MFYFVDSLLRKFIKVIFNRSVSGSVSGTTITRHHVEMGATAEVILFQTKQKIIPHVSIH